MSYHARERALAPRGGQGLLCSVKDHRISPVTAVRGEDRVVTLRNGQRRILAAREVGLTTVPAHVLPASAANESAEVVERIVNQIVTNDPRDRSDPVALANRILLRLCWFG